MSLSNLSLCSCQNEPYLILYSGMVVRMKHTKGKRNRVRSHHALKARAYPKCGHCKAEMLPHTVCSNCGYYAGRQVVDVLAKLDKKEKKKKERELHAHEAEAAESGKPMTPEGLSHR